MAIKIAGHAGELKATENLVEFLIARQPASRKFLVGDWLQKADTETLAHLNLLIEKFLDGEYSKDLDDLHSFIICALAAERGARKVNVSDEIFIGTAELLRGLISLEDAQRSGWIIIHTPLSIELNSSVDMEVTDEGLKQGKKIRPH